MNQKTDFFISHSSDDKPTFVKKLVDHLIINGATLFYDEYNINLGDSISESINRGLTQSNNAIVVLSQSFFLKPWTNGEIQAIFNKHLSQGYKIILVYHNITHDDVVERYPLLADKKSINSSEGVEKITEELFKAINKKFQVSYLKNESIPFKNPENGISISMFMGFPNRANLSENKTIYEMGNPSLPHSRLKIFVWKYERLYLEITDSKYRKYSISVDLNKWISIETHFLHASINIQKKTIELIVDDDILEKIVVPDLYINDFFSTNISDITGCSFNLSDPCPLIVQFFSIGSSSVEPVSFYKRTKSLITDLTYINKT